MKLQSNLEPIDIFFFFFFFYIHLTPHSPNGMAGEEPIDINIAGNSNLLTISFTKQ